MSYFRFSSKFVGEWSFLILGTELENFLEGCQILSILLLGCQVVLPVHDGVSNCRLSLTSNG